MSIKSTELDTMKTMIEQEIERCEYARLERGEEGDGEHIKTLKRIYNRNFK